MALVTPLVPSEMDASTFWTRYFFRVHQIEKDEEKRKQLLAGTFTACLGDEQSNLQVLIYSIWRGRGGRGLRLGRRR